MALMDTYTAPGRGDPSALGDDADYTAALNSGDLNRLFAVIERENNLPPGYLAKTAQIESGGNPNAKNPNSSAGGLFQFINSTAKQYGIGDKMDPVQSTLGAAMLAADNANYLTSKLGREPTAGELYLAHQQGPAGAAKILANPNAPAASVVGAQAANLNGGAGLTAGQLAGRWTSKFGGGAAPTMTADANAITDSSRSAGLMGGSNSDSLMGSAGSDRLGGGLMSKPYDPGSDGVDAGSILGAIGMAMLSGTRQNPMGNLPAILNAQAKDRQTTENQRYQRWRDERDFGVGRSDKETAQKQWEATYGLQKTSNELAQARETRADELERERLKLAKDAAGQPKIMSGADGSIVAVKPDASGVTTLAPGQRVLTESGKVEERKNILRAQGKDPDAPENQSYVYNGKLPDNKAPTVQKIKQADGSEISVQWDDTKQAWVPMVAPEGGNAVRPTGKPITEAQGKDIVFFDRGKAADDTLNKHGAALLNGAQQGASKVPGVGNYLTSEEFKLGKNAEELFLSAFLRKESGAAIGPSEYAMYGRMFIPQPGDSEAIVKQKAENRRIGLESIRAGLPPTAAMTRVTDANPQKVTTQDEYNGLAPGTAYIDPFGKKRIKGGAQ